MKVDEQLQVRNNRVLRLAAVRIKTLAEGGVGDALYFYLQGVYRFLPNARVLGLIRTGVGVSRGGSWRGGAGKASAETFASAVCLRWPPQSDAWPRE